MNALRLLALPLALSAASAFAQDTVTLDFDDLVGSGPIPPGYGGVADWGGWEYWDTPDPGLPPVSGATRIRSSTPPQRVAFGRDVVFGRARYFAADPIRVDLFRAGQLVASSQTFPASTGGPSGGFFFTAYEGLVDAFELVSSSGNHAFDDLVYWEMPPTLGDAFCTPNDPNSVGRFGTLAASGSLVVADDDLTLRATGLPTHSFGFVIVSRTQGIVASPTGPQRLCLNGSIGRFVGPAQIMTSGATGSFDLDVDLTAIPTPTGFVSTVPGDTWSFQVWYRDVPSTSRFTTGVELTFQ
ncbi:MAG: hypothetical protein AAGB93_16870 [Planctomycetota bacterium]